MRALCCPASLTGNIAALVIARRGSREFWCAVRMEKVAFLAVLLTLSACTCGSRAVNVTNQTENCGTYTASTNLAT